MGLSKDHFLLRNDNVEKNFSNELLYSIKPMRSQVINDNSKMLYKWQRLLMLATYCRHTK